MPRIRSLERALGLGRDPVRIEAGAALILVEGGARLIDVRRSDDRGLPLSDGERILPEEIADRVGEFDRDVPIVLACSCPAEWTSVRAAYWLRDRGFEAFAVTGGVPALDVLPRSSARVLPALSAEPDIGDASTPLGALRYSRYRIYSTGVLLSLTGTWLASAAFGYVVLLLGGSPATLGLIGFLNTIPNLLWGLPAGALADKYDRRRLLLMFQSLNLLVAATLAIMYATDTLTVAWMAALALIGGSLGALSFPETQGILAATVPKEELESAVAVNSLILQVARFIGPALAGLLLTLTGPTWVFVVDAASFLGVIVAVSLLPPALPTTDQSAGLGGALKEGFAYVFGQRSIAALMALTFFAGFFGTPPVAFMLPAIARDVLDGGPGTLGALTASIGLGSLVGSMVMLWLARRPNKGEPAIAGFFVTALAVAGVGASHVAGVSFVLAVAGGFSGVLFVGLSTVVVQSTAGDDMRARAMAIWAAAFVGVLPFGALVTGGLTSVLGAGGAVVFDGLAMFAGGALVLLWRPEVRWLGCAALPESCWAGLNPEAVAVRESGVHAALTAERV